MRILTRIVYGRIREGERWRIKSHGEIKNYIFQAKPRGENERVEVAKEAFPWEDVRKEEKR